MVGRMTESEQRAALRKLGIPPRTIDRYLASGGRVVDSALDYVRQRGLSLVYPVCLVIPWSALASDNEKYSPAKRGEKAVLILTKKYREAKARIAELAAAAMTPGDHQFEPLAHEALAFVARVYVPDNRRHDVVNFAKIAQDAMTGVVFLDDSQLHDARWIRAGVDVDRPRAEVEVTPI